MHLAQLSLGSRPSSPILPEPQLNELSTQMALLKTASLALIQGHSL